MAFDFLLLYGFLYCLQFTAVVLFKLFDAAALIRTCARDTKSKLVKNNVVEGRQLLATNV